MKIVAPPRHTPVSIRSPGTPLRMTSVDARLDVLEPLEADHRLGVARPVASHLACSVVEREPLEADRAIRALHDLAVDVGLPAGSRRRDRNPRVAEPVPGQAPLHEVEVELLRRLVAHAHRWSNIEALAAGT